MKDNKIFLRVFSWFLMLFFIIYILFTCYIYLSCFSASHQLELNNDHEVLRIKIYGSTSTSEGNTVSGTFSIIDSNGNEIAVIERSWSGAYLSVDFAQVTINGKYYLFPVKIFGKNRIIEDRNERKKGTSLEKYYNDDGQCMLLGFGSSLKDRKNLYKISIFANRKYPVINFGLIDTYRLDLSNCKTNTYYSITYNQDGRLGIQEL